MKKNEISSSISSYSSISIKEDNDEKEEKEEFYQKEINQLMISYEKRNEIQKYKQYSQERNERTQEKKHKILIWIGIGILFYPILLYPYILLHLQNQTNFSIKWKQRIKIFLLIQTILFLCLLHFITILLSNRFLLKE